MKPQTQLKDRKHQRRQRAIALVIVLAMVSMMTIFMLAIFSVSRTELTSSVKYADGQNAKELADMAVNVVMAQIWDGTQRTASNPAIWASQPGAIRRYNLNGTFNSGYKLYSSSQMRVSGAENGMVNDNAPASWAAQSGVYADLNEPVIRPDADGDGNPELIFPIIDPRAYIPGMGNGPTSPNIEGFWYNSSFSGVVPASSDDDLNTRLPMPVQWVYVLKNGMMGTVTGTGNTLNFVPAASGAENMPSEDNPIVGRIAFWTDDETSKININTAGEPTPWTTPSFIHDRDMYFAHFQPMAHEYQRYPGHPATVAMSSVLFPNQDMDLYGRVPGDPTYAQILSRKERIYDVMPKIHSGGSKAGTVAYWLATDSTRLGNNLAQSVDLTTAIRERLYASVDDMMFSQRLGGSGGRQRVLQDEVPNKATDIFTSPRQLERARFFLTAHSRMPEVNMYGMPRVAIWPAADESLGADRRTGYDNLIAFCSSLGRTPQERANNSYFFRRRDYSSPTTDINIPRNQNLLAMLNDILATKVMPGGATFASKYDRGDSTQILVQIFDYIRSTNLYDGFLSPTRQQLVGDGNAPDGDPLYRYETYHNTANVNKFGGFSDGAFYANKPPHLTYTPDRMSRMTGNRGVAGDQRTERAVEYTFPGHGSVVPSEYQNGAFRGMGRFPTVTEVGFHFLCSADGNPDKGSFRMATRRPDGSYTKNGATWPGAQAAAAQWTLTSPHFQGGRTAVKIDPLKAPERGIGQAVPLLKVDVPMFVEEGPQSTTLKGFTGERQFWYSNFPRNPQPGAYGTNPNAQPSDPSHPNNHPGFKPENWNMTLPQYRPGAPALQLQSPLAPGQKRVQGMINLELCVPMLGYGPVHPEFTLVIEGLQNMRLNNEPLFQGTGNNRVVWKTGLELYHLTDGMGTVTAGGFVDGASMSYARRVQIPGFPPDPLYDPSAKTSGDPNRGLRNYDLATRFLTVEGDRMEFTGSPLTISIYAGHNVGAGVRPVQVLQIPAIQNVTVPVPELITISTDYRDQPNNLGNRTTQRRIHAPQWWSFSWAGVFQPPGNPVGGRFRTSWPASELPTPGSDRVGLAVGAGISGNMPRGTSILFGYDAASGNHNNLLLVPYNGFIRQDTGAVVNMVADNPGSDCSATGQSDRQTDPNGNIRDCRGTDVMFSIVPVHGDVRHLMARTNVPASDWMPHPGVNAMMSNPQRPRYFAHNISRANANANPGFDRGPPNSNALRLVPNVAYNLARVPDVPASQQAVRLASMYGDFDNGPGGMRDGAWLNKPDEGNTGVAWFSQNGQTRRIPTAYYQEEDRAADAGGSYMTPNRIIPSPVMFGSLPSRVMGGQPWRTLLFRPQRPQVANPVFHPGAPAYMNGVNPADHYILDLFWMPVVEPYAISETFSSAGKVNINYQIVPFNHIRRSTAIHAALKGEILAAIPNADGASYLDYPAGNADTIDVTRDDQNMPQQAYHFRQPWTDIVGNRDRYTSQQMKFWHRKIEVEQMGAGNAVLGTLQQFEGRFNFVTNPFTPVASQGLFRTASQICEIHLIPRIIPGNPTVDGGDPPGNPYTPLDMTNVQQGGKAFWAQRQLTGDNTRERPYANIYAKITTQSNTFRVFYKAQTIRKARSVAPDEFDPARDRVTSEYRGTTLIERKLDANDPALANTDYANNPTATPLDSFYRFRVLETKRFAP